CSPNEPIVIQLRRERCAHDVSSMLSANMVSSPDDTVVADMDTARTEDAAASRKNKGRVVTRPLGTFRTLKVSHRLSYLGAGVVVAGFVGVVAGFGVVAAGLVVPGFGPVPVVAGAGTPDCRL